MIANFIPMYLSRRRTVGQDRQKCKETSNLDVIVMDIMEGCVRGHSTTTWTRRGGGGVSPKSTLVHPGGGVP